MIDVIYTRLHAPPEAFPSHSRCHPPLMAYREGRPPQVQKVEGSIPGGRVSFWRIFLLTPLIKPSNPIAGVLLLLLFHFRAKSRVIHQSMGLKHESSSGPLHISAEQFFFIAGLHVRPAGRARLHAPSKACATGRRGNPTLKIRKPNPETRNVKPEVRSTKPETRSPKPET